MKQGQVVDRRVEGECHLVMCELRHFVNPKSHSNPTLPPGKPLCRCSTLERLDLRLEHVRLRLQLHQHICRLGLCEPSR